jgi:pyruvate dehydrogenase E1 component beta subunit
MAESRRLTMAEAVREAMTLEMRRDPRVFLVGEDIGKIGGAFGVTGKMIEEFGPERMLNTPISETAITGIGVGSAAAGFRPIVEIMFNDFIGVAMDEIVNQAAKMRYMFGGKVSVPMVIRTACGAGVRGGGQHSQSLEAWVAHIPGLKVVYPSNSYDAKGLLISSIRDDNPVIFMEHKALYSTSSECPEGDYTVPLSQGKYIRQGDDVTIVAWGMMVNRSEKAASELEKSGISVDLIDVRTIIPLDINAILDSVKKTGRLVIVQEAYRTAGFAAEIAAIVSEEIFPDLKGPVIRVTGPDTTVPLSPILEDEYIPDPEKIKNAVIKLTKNKNL